MKTLFLLLAQFESVEIPLKKICHDHLGMDLPRAKRLAFEHKLPVPFYKKSGKGEYFCSINDWAEYIDSKKQEATNEWEKINGKQC